MRDVGLTLPARRTMPFTAVLPSADMRIDGPPYPSSKPPNEREKLTCLSNWLNLGSQCRDTSVVRLTQGIIVRCLVAISSLLQQS